MLKRQRSILTDGRLVHLDAKVECDPALKKQTARCMERLASPGLEILIIR